MSEKKPEPCPHCGLITRLDICPNCDWDKTKNKYYYEPEEE